MGAIHIIHAISVALKNMYSVLFYIVACRYGLTGFPPTLAVGRPFDVYNVTMMLVTIYSVWLYLESPYSYF